MSQLAAILAFPNPDVSSFNREIHPITIDQFCEADDLGEWEQRQIIGGFIILQFPRMALFCAPGGSCIAISAKGTDLDAYFGGAGRRQVA